MFDVFISNKGEKLGLALKLRSHFLTFFDNWVIWISNGCTVICNIFIYFRVNFSSSALPEGAQDCNSGWHSEVAHSHPIHPDDTTPAQKRSSLQLASSFSASSMVQKSIRIHHPLSRFRSGTTTPQSTFLSGSVGDNRSFHMRTLAEMAMLHGQVELLLFMIPGRSYLLQAGFSITIHIYST